MPKTRLSKLVIFTAHFPYGNTETFLANEIALISHAFDKIILIPCSYPKGNKNKTTLANNVKSFPPYLSNNIPLRILRAFFNKAPGGGFFADFFLKRIFLSKSRLNSWTNNLICCRTFLTSKVYKVLRRIVNSQDVLYFYWGVGSVSIIPFLDIQSKIVVRLHGADAYANVNGEYNYLPLRNKIYSRANCLLPISDGLSKYLVENYNAICIEKKIYVSRLATVGYGENPYE